MTSFLNPIVAPCRSFIEPNMLVMLEKFMAYPEICLNNGNRELLKTPKSEVGEIHGIQDRSKTPKSEVGEIHGIQDRQKTPKFQESPKSEVAEIHGIQNRQKTPKSEVAEIHGIQDRSKTPKSEVAEIHGIQNRQKTPKFQELPKSQNIITPHQMADTLFWCFYIAKYGYGDFLAIGNKYKNKEIAVKQAMIDHIKKDPTSTKSDVRKLSKVAVQEILSELMIDKKTSYPSFFVMCLLNGLTVFLVNRDMKLYMKFDGSKSVSSPDTTFIFYKKCDGCCSVDLDTTPQKIDSIISQMTPIDFGIKPIKSASTYKAGELSDLAKQLGIESTGLKKQELYNEIIVYMTKF